MGEVTNAMKNEYSPAMEDRMRHMADLENRLHDADSETPTEIRREIARTRLDLEETINTIRHRLEWDELATDAFETARRKWHEKQPDVFGAARRNPGPVALTALGLGWMIFRGSTDGTSETRFKQRMREKIGEKAGEFKEAIAQNSDAARHGASEKASSAMHRARDRANDSFQSNPMAMGALAMAVGAACGLSMPLTHQEEKVITKAGEETSRITKPQNEEDADFLRDKGEGI